MYENRSAEDDLMAKEFWTNVKTLCTTWKDLAEKIGSTERTLSSYASRNTMPRLDLAYKISDALGVCIDKLVSRPVSNNLNLDTNELALIKALRNGTAEEIAYKHQFLKTLVPTLNIMASEKPEN